MQLNLSEFLLHLLTKKQFYSRLASSLERVPKPGLGTLAVGLRNGRAALFYDPAFLQLLSMTAGEFALEHELLHLLLDHIPRYLELLAMQPTDQERKKAAAVYNIAMDCSINTMLRSHDGFADIEEILVLRGRAELKKAHDEACEKAKAAGEPEPPMPEVDDTKFGMVLPEKYDLPPEGSFEHYQYLLMKRVKLIEVQLSFGGNTHDFWQGDPSDKEGQGEGEGKDGKGRSNGRGKGGGGGKPQKGGGSGGSGNKDLVFSGSTFGDLSSEELLSVANRVREQIKQTLRDTVRSMGGVGRGTLPGNLAEWLNEYLADPIVPWWQVLTTYARMSRTSKFKRSTQLPNRTLLALSEEDDSIIPMPGRIRDQSWRVFLMVDTSGSMSTESLEIARSELFHMLAVDEGMEIRYLQGDCVVHSDVVLKSGDEVPAEVHGRGGTDFDAYFAHMSQYVNDDAKTPDIVIVYTDGYAPPVTPAHRLPDDIPVLWLVTPAHSANFDNYGHVIVCDPAHNARRKN